MLLRLRSSTQPSGTFQELLQGNEAILFATSEPQTKVQIENRVPHGADVAEALVHVRKRYEGRGVNLVKIGDGWAFRTAPDLGFLMQKEQVEVRKLSRAAIETLAIIAYHQPVTRAEIEEIRGVSVSSGACVSRPRVTPATSSSALHMSASGAPLLYSNVAS